MLIRIRLSFALLLFLGLVNASLADVAGWGDNIYLEYIDGKADNQNELRKLVFKRWNEEFIVNYRDLGERSIRDCGELIQHEITGVVPPVPRDFYLARALQVDCYALSVGSSLGGFSRTYIARDLDGLVHELAQLKFPAQDDQIKNFFSGISRLRNIKCQIDACVVQGGWGDSIYTFKMKAFGDYNKDLLEDLVVTVSKGISTGDPTSFNIGFVVTRKCKNRKLEVLDLYVPWLIKAPISERIKGKN